jgi:hypothetical protein
MKGLLIVGGVLFLLLAVVLFIAAIVVFLVGRKRSQPAAVSPQPMPVQPSTAPGAFTPPPSTSFTPPPSPPSTPAPPAFTPPPSPLPPVNAVPPAGDEGATVVLDMSHRKSWGSLHGTSGPVAGRVVPIDADGFYIGREASMSQVVINSPSISKRHVWVGVRDGAVVAVDQGSTNGTYLNAPENRITETQLKPGDTLIISHDIARFTYRS